MSAIMKAVSSFNDSRWMNVVPSSYCNWDPAYEVLSAWSNLVGDYGIEVDDIETGVEWQEIDSETIAYRILGKVLLVVAWDYDADYDGERYVGRLTIHSWHMGSEVSQ